MTDKLQELKNMHTKGELAKMYLEERQQTKEDVLKLIDEIYNLRELPTYEKDDSVRDFNGKLVRSRTYTDIHYKDIIDIIFRELKQEIKEKLK